MFRPATVLKRWARPWEDSAMGFRVLAAAVVLVGALVVEAQEIPRPGTTLPPQTVRTVNAVYTPEAKAAGIEGIVRVEVLVLTDGTVGEGAKVIQSLDTRFGLDDEAVKASKQWLFKPATKDGKPVSATVVIEQTFTLRPQ
jgi:TonB family protein